MNSQNFGVSFVVVFGSAAAFASGASTRQPRDIDVAFGGSIHSEADAVAIARQWAQSVGLPDSLPVDAHRAFVWNDTLTLPIPAGLTGSSVVLVGQTFLRVQWREVVTTSAIIRSAGTDPQRCALALASHWLRVTLPPTTPGSLPVAVFDGDREIGRSSDGWIDFQVVPGASAGDLGPDSVYTGEGIDALRRAITHCSAEQWKETLARFGVLHPSLTGVAAFLGRIVREDLPAETVRAIRAGSTTLPSGAVSIRFEHGAVGTTYAGGVKWAIRHLGVAPWIERDIAALELGWRNLAGDRFQPSPFAGPEWDQEAARLDALYAKISACLPGSVKRLLHELSVTARACRILETLPMTKGIRARDGGKSV